MIESSTSVEAARPRPDINTILNSSVTIKSKVVGTEYNLKPHTNWKAINEFDRATKVPIKGNSEGVALSDFLLKNVRSMSELAYEEKFIKDSDIQTRIELNPDTTYRPYSFLRIEKGKLIIPDNLTAAQTQELMMLIYEKTVNNTDEPINKEQPNVLIEKLHEKFKDFKQAGEVDRKGNLSNSDYDGETLLGALNIALRKSVEKANEEASYSLTQVHDRVTNEGPFSRRTVGETVTSVSQNVTRSKIIEGEKDMFVKNLETDEAFAKRKLQVTAEKIISGLTGGITKETIIKEELDGNKNNVADRIINATEMLVELSKIGPEEFIRKHESDKGVNMKKIRTEIENLQKLKENPTRIETDQEFARRKERMRTQDVIGAVVANEAKIQTNRENPTFQTEKTMELRRELRDSGTEAFIERYKDHKGVNLTKIDKEIDGLKRIEVEQIIADQTAQYDLMMAQASDILIPAKARLEMRRQEEAIEKTEDYKEKARLRSELGKDKQMWRLAIFRYYNAQKPISGGPDLFTSDMNDNMLFTPDEQREISNRIVAVRDKKSVLDKRRDGGFLAIDIDMANEIKAEELLKLLGVKDSDQKLKKVLDQATDIMSRRASDLTEANKYQDDLINKLPVTVDFRVDKKFAKQIIEEALNTKIANLNRLKKLPKEEDVSIKPQDLKFASNGIDMAIKGIDLLYRRGVSQEIKDLRERYHGYDIEKDDQYKDHLVPKRDDRQKLEDLKNRLKRGAEPPVPAGTTSMSQSVESATKIPVRKKLKTKKTPTGLKENLNTEEQKIKDEQAVELGKILDLGDGIKNSADFLRVLGEKRFFVLNPEGEEQGHPYELRLKTISLNSVDQLNLVSHLSKHLPEGTTIQIDLLNVVIPEKENTDTLLNDFNIDHLVLSRDGSENSESRIRLGNGGVKIISIEQGNFMIETSQAPERVDAANNKKHDIVLYVTEEGFKKVITSDKNEGTVFNLDTNSKILIAESKESNSDHRYSDFPEIKGNWDNTQKFNGENILVQDENGVYILKPRTETEAASVDKNIGSTQNEPTLPDNDDNIPSFLRNRQQAAQPTTPTPAPAMVQIPTPPQSDEAEPVSVPEPTAQEGGLSAETVVPEQKKYVGEVITPSPFSKEEEKRPSSGKKQNKLLAWLSGIKKEADEKTAGRTRSTRAEKVRDRRPQVPVAAPVNSSQTDNTMMGGTPANISKPGEVGQQVGTQATEAPADKKDDLLDFFSNKVGDRKIASADDESSSEGGAEVNNDDLDIPTFLRNRR